MQNESDISNIRKQKIKEFDIVGQFKWDRNHFQESKRIDLQFIDTTNHPLTATQKVANTDESITNSNKSTLHQEKSHTKEFSDPLRSFHSEVESDPLSQDFASSENNIQSSTSITGQINRSITWRTNQTFLQWNLKANLILKKYTTNKNIPVISNILESSGGDDDVAPDADLEGSGEPLGAITLEDRIKLRLESLKPKENSTLLSQTEYIKHLEAFNAQLSQSWNKNDRVTSLRIVIKCAKMLGRNPVPQCYPSIFVLVSRVLDTFGQLVSERIKNRSTIRDEKGKLISKLPKIFTSMDVPEEAKEVCRNWFYKISSIRELIARLCVEISILSCNSYIVDDKNIIVSHVRRLSSSIRGIGDPLTAAYARCYLARKAIELIPEHSEVFEELLIDTLNSRIQMQTESFQNYLNKIEMEFNDYLDLFQPAVEWIMESIGAYATASQFNNILQLYINSEWNQSFMIDSLIKAFDPQIISEYASLILNLIFESKGNTQQHKALQSLGEKFAQYPPKISDQLQLLNTIWVKVAEVESLKDYMNLAEVYIEYVSKVFSQKEVNILLKHIHSRLEPISNDSSLMDLVEENMEGVLLNVMENMPDFVQAFNMEFLLPIFDLLKPSSRVRVSKGILLAFSRREGTISDPVILSSLYDLARTVHDSVNELSPKESKDDVCFLLEEFISRIDYGTQLDKQLNFYMDCRRSFLYFDKIKRLLSTKVLSMCMRANIAMKGNHNRKSINFAKSCIAFCHITIPSIHDPIIRLRLYLQSAEVCVANNLFSQAETFLELIIQDVSKLTSTIYSEELNLVVSIESELCDILSQMASLLIAVPGHPEKGPFVIIQQYLKVIQDFNWEIGGNYKALLLCRVLRMLFTYLNENPPYNISLNFSNSDLFIADSKFYNTVENYINGVIKLILLDLGDLSTDEDSSASKKSAEVAIEFVNSILRFQNLDKSLEAIIKKCLEITIQTPYVGYASNSVKDIMRFGSENAKSIISQTQFTNL